MNYAVVLGVLFAILIVGYFVMTSEKFWVRGWRGPRWGWNRWGWDGVPYWNPYTNEFSYNSWYYNH